MKREREAEEGENPEPGVPGGEMRLFEALFPGINGIETEETECYSGVIQCPVDLSGCFGAAVWGLDGPYGFDRDQAEGEGEEERVPSEEGDAILFPAP